MVLVSVTALSAACSSDAALPAAALPGIQSTSLENLGSPVPLTPLVQLAIPTFDGSGQATHPDVVRFRAGWNGWEYWMAMTPFPQANKAFENPSILVSHDGRSWQPPDGLVNPLARTPARGGYNSDPDLHHDPVSNQLVLMYREVTATSNLIRTTSSSDGVHWSAPTLAFRRPNHGMVSPSVTVGPAGTPMLWYVDAGPKKCAQRTTRVKLMQGSSGAALLPATPEEGWSAPVRTLTQPGMNIWHLDVTWVPERQEYWAVYVAYQGHACWGQDLYFARSPDGVSWTSYDIPFLRHDEASWTANTLYRSSALYDASRDVIQFFVSGADAERNWHLGYVEYALPSFLSALAHGSLKPATASSQFPVAAAEIEP